MKKSVALSMALGVCLGEGASAWAQEPTLDPGPEIPILHYVTYSNKRLEVADFSKYQTARSRWLGGSIATGVGIGLSVLGSFVLIYSATSDAQKTGLDLGTARILGGITLGLGAAGIGVGVPFWYLGRRDIQATEARLPAYEGPPPF